MKTFATTNIEITSWCGCEDMEFTVTTKLKRRNAYYNDCGELVWYAKTVTEKDLRRIFKKHIILMKQEIESLPSTPIGQEFCHE